jgi:hypothetical protein
LEGISGDFLAFGEEEIQKSRGGSIGFTLIWMMGLGEEPRF